MKKLFTLLLILGIVSCQKADVEPTFQEGTTTGESTQHTYRIPYQSAVNTLKNFLEITTDEPTTRSSKSYEILDYSPITVPQAATRSSTIDADTILYVVNFADDGFAVLSADMRIPEILAITEQGFLSAEDFIYEESDFTRSGDEDSETEILGLASDEEFNQFVGSFLLDYALYSLETYPEREEEVATRNLNFFYEGVWYQLISKIDPMLKTKWHQNSPFNNTASAVKGKTVAAGCVAISISQILAYKKPLGKYTTATWNSINNVNFYSSGIMNDGTLTERQLAADFVWNVGYLASTKYGGSSSSASPKDSPIAYTCFGMSWAKRYTTDLQDKVDQYLEADYPVQYGASSNTTGHSFVLDGRIMAQNRSNGSIAKLYHVNFGWGGRNDGWYCYNLFVVGTGIRAHDSSIGDRPDYTASNLGRHYHKSKSVILYLM